MQPLIIPALKAHLASFIFLHGLGDTGNGWAPVMRMVARALPNVKFILPHAPTRPVTLNNNMVMPAWYDIISLESGEKHVDLKGIDGSADYLGKLVKEELDSGVDKVFIGGFSQGGVIALRAGLASADLKIGAIVALSCYLPAGIEYKYNKDVPVFMGHGHDDQIVHFKWGEQSCRSLKALGYKNIAFHSYPALQHSASDQELDDMVEFLVKIMQGQDRDL